MLLAVALWRPTWPWLLAASVPLGASLATATLTVLHDAGHRRLSRRTWVNVLAVQTAAPIGLWVSHWTLKHRVHHRVTQVYPLRATAPRAELPTLHRTTVADVVAASDAPLVEYATFAGAVRGHWRVLRYLGQRAVPIRDGQPASATGPLFARPR